MTKFYTSKSQFNTHRFEIVEKIPNNYQIWCIGDNMGSPELLPLAIVNKECQIDPATLKTVKMEKAEVSFLNLVAIRYGLTNLKRAKAYTNKKNGKPQVKELAKQAAAIFEKYM